MKHRRFCRKLLYSVCALIFFVLILKADYCHGIERHPAPLLMTGIDSVALAGSAGGIADDDTSVRVFSDEDRRLESALSQIGKGPAIVDISKGSWRIEKDLSVPQHVTLRFSPEALLEIDSNTTLTVNGPIIAHHHRIFSGDGKVVFGTRTMETVCPKWWGAVGDGITDDSDAFTACIRAAAGRSKVSVPPGTYKASVILLDNTTLTGSGCQTVFIPVNAGSLGEGVSVFYALNSTTIRLSDLRIEGRRVGGSRLSSFNGIHFDGVQDFVLHEIAIHDVGDVNEADPVRDAYYGGFGILIDTSAKAVQASARGLIERCRLSHIAGGGMFRGDGICVHSESGDSSRCTNQITIKDCTICETGRHAIAVASTAQLPHQITIVNNIIENTALAGVDV